MNLRTPQFSIVVALLCVLFEALYANPAEDFRDVNLKELELLEACALRTNAKISSGNKFLAITKNTEELALSFESFYWLKVKIPNNDFWIRSGCLNGRKDPDTPCPLYNDPKLLDQSQFFLIGNEFQVVEELDGKVKLKLKIDTGYMGSQCFGLPMMYSEKFKKNYEKVNQKSDPIVAQPVQFKSTKTEYFGISYRPQVYHLVHSDSRDNSNEFSVASTTALGVSYHLVFDTTAVEFEYNYRVIGFKNSALGASSISLSGLSGKYIKPNQWPWGLGYGFAFQSQQNPYFLNIDNQIQNFIYMDSSLGAGLIKQIDVFDRKIEGSLFFFVPLFSSQGKTYSLLGGQLLLTTVLNETNNYKLNVFFEYSDFKKSFSESLGSTEINIDQRLKNSILGLQYQF